MGYSIFRFCYPVKRQLMSGISHICGRSMMMLKLRKVNGVLIKLSALVVKVQKQFYKERWDRDGER